LVAPTGMREKNPCSHFPSNATRSFKAKRPLIKFTIVGATGKRWPVHISVSYQSSVEWQAEKEKDQGSDDGG